MRIEEIKQILQNKVSNLVSLRGSAFNAGQLAEVTRLDAEIEETNLTIQSLGD